VGLYKHFLDRLGGNRSTEEVLRNSRQRQRQREAGGNVDTAVALMSSKDEDEQAPGKSLERLLGRLARRNSTCSPPLVCQDDETAISEEGVPYCLGSKLSQYMPPDLLFDW
jgi:hypothetical protein